ncbi:glycosyltransferase [Roseospira marina]|uniref:Glycosyltransferase n=1 Tax=Roseospira marina TaxID=140057 RepID=A0A5M6ID92_9PROT|nr:glycosyltransferase [Roseospira marina]KAA5605729.1 glycosyltransferase [Roseospira marina]MBB4313530.1 putative glycosyltransferase [Roseospira marina]MBB5086692.1 putative glycosyltransferase [Roseospira marina]
MSSTPRPPLAEGPVLLYVQHVMGVGHLNRMAALARGLAGCGREVVLVSGGRPVPHLLPPDPARPVRVEQLPSLAAAGFDFTALVDAEGAPVSPMLWQARAAHLAGLVDALRPALLVVEMYPFGRRAFAAEIDALIDRARARRPEVRVACSVRDILVRKTKPGWAERMRDAANARFDLILVHGDPTLIPFGATFPLVDELRPPLVHTGYVVEPAGAADGTDGTDEILVSAGGGAMGAALMAAAVAAPPLCTGRARDRRWRVLVGRNQGPDARDRLCAAAAPGARVEWVRPDFRAMLGRAVLSVSQAGYNTVAEVLAAGVPAVLVPWGEGRESEQRDRAAALERLGRARVVSSGELCPGTLAQAVTAVLGDAVAHHCARMTIALDGVARAREALLG